MSLDEFIPGTAAHCIVIDHDGTAVHLQVSPCCWMHQGYGLQFQLALKPREVNAASILVHDRSLDSYGITTEARLEMAEARARRWLAENGVQPLRDAAAKWAVIEADFEREDAKRRAAADKRRKALWAKRKAEGYTHHILAAIHPKHGGDDYLVECFCKVEPTPAILAQVTAKSAVKDDYKVTAL